MDKDNRQFQRVGMEEIVEVRFLPGSSPARSKNYSNQPHYLKAKNISKEGMCLETPEFFIPNQIFKLDFRSIHNGQAQAYASVVWSERNACGLRFIKPGELLDELVREEKTPG